MKQDRTPARRAAWLLLAAPALLVTPAYAQDTPQTAPPPVQRTVPDAPAPAPAPVTQAAPTPTTDTTSTTSRTTIAPGAREVVDEARIAAQRAAPARQASRAPARAMRTVTTRTTTARAPAAAAPVAAPAPAPVAAAPATDPIAPPPATDPVAPTANDATAPVEAPVAADTRTTTTETGGAPLWPLVLIAGLIILAGAGYAMWSRRRRAQAELYEAEPAYYEEPVAYAEPVEEPAYVAPVAAAPVAAAPLMARDTATDVESVAAEDATLTEAEAEEVAALTGGTAPVSNRPWLEFAMRPVRAGTSADEAVVEIELTVANSGSQAARNVRVSAFMLSDREATDMERLLLDRPGDAAVDPVTIEPGEGARIDATLAALKADIGEEGAFSPVVIADARYTLPDGSEGRTSASFVVGITREGGEISPIDLADRVMREDIEARLHGQPQHA